MNVFKKSDKSTTKKLSRQFAILTNLVIFSAVIVMAAFQIGTIGKLYDVFFQEKNRADNVFAGVVIDVAQEAVLKKEFSALDKMAKDLIRNKLAESISIIKKENNVIVWSKNTANESAALAFVENEKRVFKYPQKAQSNYVFGNIGEYTVFIKFGTQSHVASYLNSVIDNNKILSLGFIFLGLVCAFFMTKMVTQPLNVLASGTKELSGGNLKYRIAKTNYEELDELVDAFNLMAQKLDEYYSLLEQKVADRTKEISVKNDELQGAYKELKEAQSILVHSEKMRSLGELVAGITHEINNPVNFIYGNIIHLNNYSKDLIDIIDKYSEVEDKLPEDCQQPIGEFKEEIDYDFIKSDLPELIRSCKEGAERTKNIILDLKSFARLDEMVVNEIDLHKEIDTTLNILHNKYKDKIAVHKEFGELPAVESYGGQINQVFMNILDNASFAIKDKGDVYIRTKKVDENVIIEIEDNGAGMDENTKKKLFDPFFTTKPVGQGTGLGMSISYKVIKNHNGEILAQSEVGKGTKILITLPVKGLKKSEENTAVEEVNEA